MKKTVFDCQMCGQCCEGEGGIVLSPKDLKRLYEGLNLEKQAFLDAYGVFRNGKWQVRTGEDGNCIFFRPDKAVPSMPSSPMFAGHGRFFGGTWPMPKASIWPRRFAPVYALMRRMRNSWRKARAIWKKTGS